MCSYSYETTPNINTATDSHHHSPTPQVNLLLQVIACKFSSFCGNDTAKYVETSDAGGESWLEQSAKRATNMSEIKTVTKTV